MTNHSHVGSLITIDRVPGATNFFFQLLDIFLWQQQKLTLPLFFIYYLYQRRKILRFTRQTQLEYCNELLFLCHKKIHHLKSLNKKSYDFENFASLIDSLIKEENATIDHQFFDKIMSQLNEDKDKELYSKLNHYWSYIIKQ